MDAPATCLHCGLRLDGSPFAPFCCAGCRTAREVIAACGLDAFYRLRGDGPPAPAAAPVPDAAWFDSPAFARDHVHRFADGSAGIRWRVFGIHCAACVWLLERLPRLAGGVLAARVDLSDETLAVRFAPERCGPGAQAALAARLGYRLQPALGAAARTAERGARRAEMLRATVAVASAVGAMHIGMSLITGEVARDLEGAGRSTFGWMSLLVALPALTYGAWPFWRGALAALRARRATLDTTVAAVLTVAVVASLARLVAGGGDLWFDAAAMFVALLLAGRLAYGAARAAALRRLRPGDGVLPDAAERLATAEAALGERVAVDDLVAGDLIAVAAGQALPADGTVVAGAGRVAAAVLTGEPRALAVGVGDAVWAGCACQAGRLVVRVAAAGADSRVGRLLAAARSAPRHERRAAADRWQAWFAPAVLALALAIWAAWQAIDPARALDQAIAIVLVCCPCALGLAAPLVGAIATARAARRGLLLRDADALAALAEAPTVVFDKTGTLTAGELTLTEWIGDPVDPALPWAAALAARSAHPACAALGDHLRARGIAPAALIAEACREEPGRGMVAATPHGELRIGNATHLGFELPAADPACSRVGIACGGRLVAAVALADGIKPGAADLVAALRARGVRVCLLSGDVPAAVATVAAVLGIDPGDAHGGCLPEDKAARITALRAEGGPVVMIGDGVNDAPALAGAEVAVGVRGGLAACLDRCDAVILDGGVDRLVDLFATARAARATVRWCLAVSLAYNVIGVALVAAGAWGPLVCALAMPVSSLTVLAIATLSNRR